ncbi:tripartite tricarboxylate transporter TctB family protein [Eleftheria terrae]|uniref:tripartite tricarboxylate transporter TctB family protein n=1 Tax=Eleftheria terrae TaxID=1597781 RepID=UPI00263BDC85|nr:tripartite tricarboxylate transporter TctB family protein [Eleftheria terrae]WKB54227.1 tripartite tricarboxylate transporter TctB family protein [Eleftheria terrae]
MKIKSQRDFVSGLMFLAVGIAFAIGAGNYSFGNSAHPGPGYFPLVLGLILAVLGAVVLFTSLSIERDGGDPIGAIAVKPLVIILGAVVLFGFCLPRLGLLISLPILIVVASLASDEFHWRDALISSVVLTAGAWAIFTKGLNLTLPVYPTIFGG